MTARPSASQYIVSLVIGVTFFGASFASGTPSFRKTVDCPNFFEASAAHPAPVTAFEITNPSRLAAAIDGVLNIAPPRPTTRPRFPGAPASSTNEQASPAETHTLDSRSRLLNLGLKPLRTDDEAMSCELDCTLMAFGEVEKGLFRLALFFRSPRAYIFDGFDLVDVPFPGDLVVFGKTSNVFDHLTHFAIVRNVAASGEIEVESKFGSIPGTFLHRIADTPPMYGKYFLVFRPKSTERRSEVERRFRPLVSKPPFPGPSSK